MKPEKILLIGIVVMVLFSSLSASSAGLFDFFTGPSDGPIQASIENGTFTNTFIKHDHGLDFYDENIYCALDISNLSTNQVSDLKNSLNNTGIEFKVTVEDYDNPFQINGTDSGFSLELVDNDHLIVQHNDTSIKVGGGYSGTFSIINGTLYVPLDEDNITINFS